MDKFIQDKIGRQEIVDKICGLVDSLQKDQNFCLALNGAWGSGKSFVMEMIEERLKKQEEYIIVKYDAWKNNFYPDPLIAILYCILDSIKDKFHLVADRNTKKLLKSVCKHTAEKAIDEIVSFLHDKGGKHAVVAFVVETIINVIKQAKSSILGNKLFDDYKSYQSLLSDSIEVLNALTAFEDYNDKQTRLIILVDEIDRCLPDEQLTVLERLHHLFDVKNCAVIVAINKESVYKNFNISYGENGREYLRKFFDYNFNLEMASAIYFQNYIWDAFVENKKYKKAESISKQQIEFLQEFIFEQLKYDFEPISSIDTRTVNRLLENIKRIIISLGILRIDFAYLLLVSYLVCCKLYNSSEFDDLKYKRSKLLVNIFENSNLSSPLLRSSSRYQYSKSVYVFYHKKCINTVNFYVNFWLFNGANSDNENRIQKIFSEEILPNQEILEKLEPIFSQVDRIST